MSKMSMCELMTGQKCKTMIQLYETIERLEQQVNELESKLKKQEGEITDLRSQQPKKFFKRLRTGLVKALPVCYVSQLFY
jgi:hypothetical protein